MPDKLTDKEIVKALECCINWKREGDCAKCPAYESEMLCVKQLRILALNLINRLQAENERLKKDKENLAISFANAVGQKMTAKAEAYKECIEKVKENSNKIDLVCSGALVQIDYTITEKKLDNLLKELVGEDNGNTE